MKINPKIQIKKALRLSIQGLFTIGARGFEPPASGTQNQRSIQAELRSVARKGLCQTSPK